MTSRDWRRLSTDAFASDVAASELCSDLTALGNQIVDDLVQLYNRVMTALLDQHSHSDSATQSQQEDDAVI